MLASFRLNPIGQLKNRSPRRWLHSRRQPIVLYEFFAVHTELAAWGDRLAGRRVIFWIDNRTAERILIRGSARPADPNVLVSWFWQRCALLRIRPEIYRVASSSNISDGPSRGDWSNLGPEVVPGRVDLPPEMMRPCPRTELEAIVWGVA